MKRGKPSNKTYLGLRSNKKLFFNKKAQLEPEAIDTTVKTIIDVEPKRSYLLYYILVVLILFLIISLLVVFNIIIKENPKKIKENKNFSLGYVYSENVSYNTTDQINQTQQNITSSGTRTSSGGGSSGGGGGGGGGNSPQTTPAPTPTPLIIDNVYPIFSNAIDNSLQLNESGIAEFNITITQTNKTVFLYFNGNRYLATNSLGDIYSVSFNISYAGNYSYYWLGYGNGVNNNLGSSLALNYIVNGTLKIYNFVLNNVSDTEMNLMWDIYGAGESGIEVRRLVNGNYSLIASLPKGSVTFTDTSLYPNTTYTYTVTAVSNDNYTTPSLSKTTYPNWGTAIPAQDIMIQSLSPFAIQINWTDNITNSHSWLIERSTDNITYTLIANIMNSFIDSPLEPSTTYYYRVRAITGWDFSSYNLPVNATTFVKPAETPNVPINVTVLVLNATLSEISWIDTNSGDSSYVLESTPPYWTEYQAQWHEIATTSLGITKINITTTPETAYYLRIKARKISNDSAYSTITVFRTASLGTGTEKTYEIGPGKTYTTLGQLNWSSLGPGDTVLIYPNKNSSGQVIPYYEKPMIFVRGTSAKPIVIKGVLDPVTLERPIIDGTNAITSSQWVSHYQPLQDLSLVLIGTTNLNNGFYSPGYFTLENLEIRNAYNGSYTGPDNIVRPYSVPAGIYIEKGDHILIKNCKIHDTAEGIFGAGQGNQRNLEYLTLDSNNIYGNSRVGSSQQHNTYIEGLNTLYQNNTYGPTRPGSAGGQLKDRGSGTIIRYNYIEGGARLIDLVESQNYFGTEIALDSYHYTYVYGNILNDTTGAPGIHYGYDSGIYPTSRKGVLYYENNTFISPLSKSEAWRMKVFDLTTKGETLVAKNNIIRFTSNNPPDMDILNCDNLAHFDHDHITPGWQYCRDRNYDIQWQGFDPFTGYIGGVNSIIDDDGTYTIIFSEIIQGNQQSQTSTQNQSQGLPNIKPSQSSIMTQFFRWLGKVVYWK